jgi:hypothetical protein
MKKTRKEYEHLYRLCQEYYAVYGEYGNRHKIEPVSENIRLKPKKFMILNHLSGRDRWAKNDLTLLSL